MTTPSLLALATFFSPEAFAAETGPLDAGALDLHVVLSDGSEASLSLSGAQPCAWQRLEVQDADGESWRIDVRAAGKEGAVLVEAALRRAGEELRVEARPTVLVAPQQEAEVVMHDGEVETYRLTVRPGPFEETGSCGSTRTVRRERRLREEG